MDISKEGILSIENISEVGITDGIMGWWPLDGNTNDISGNNINGINYNGTIVSGVKGLAYEFDGDGWIDLGDSLYLTDNHPFTAVGWMMLYTFSSRDMLLCRNDAVKSASPYTWLLGTINGTSISAYTGSAWVNVSYTFSTNTWYYLGFSFDGTNMNFYVNGNLIDTELYSFSDSTTGRNTQIGGYSGTTGDINGKTCNIRFFNRALSSKEVNVLYHMTNDSNKVKMKYLDNTLYVKRQFKETL